MNNSELITLIIFGIFNFVVMLIAGIIVDDIINSLIAGLILGITCFIIGLLFYFEDYLSDEVKE